MKFLETLAAVALGVTIGLTAVYAFIYWRIWLWWTGPLDSAVTTANYNLLWWSFVVIAAVVGGLAVWALLRIAAALERK